MKAIAGLNLKTNKGRCILAVIVVGCVAAVATAVVVPVVLTSTKNSSKAAQAAVPNDVAVFNETYNNAIEVNGTSITVKESAFANQENLPAGFTLPASVTAIAAKAFMRAKLPLNFAIPKTVASIAADAFLQTTFDNAFYWNTPAPQPGSIVVAVDQTQEYKDFVAANQGTLVNYKTIKRNTFQNKTVPADFKMPSFVTSIDHYAFANAVVPPTFRLPASIVTIGNYAFRDTRLPAGFTLPASLRTIGMDLQHSVLAYISFTEAVFPTGFTIPPTVEQIYSAAFNNAVVAQGFSIPATTSVYNYDPGAEGWTTSPDTVLEGIQIPASCKWSDARGAVAGSSVVPK